VDERPHVTRMNAEVGEAAAGTEAAGHVAHDPGEVFCVGLEVHPGGHVRAGVRHREVPGVGPHDGGQPEPGVPQLVSGDIEAYGAVARLAQETASPPGAAGHVEAYRSRAIAEAFPEPGLLLLEVERREALLIPVGMAVVPRGSRPH